MTWQKPPFIPTFLAALGILTLCGLGVWQLQRLEWKQNLLAEIEAQNAKGFALFTPTDLTEANLYRKGEVEGTFLYDKEIALAPRTQRQGRDTLIGKHIITPLRLESGEVLLVNRGWAPPDYESAAKESEKITIAGMIRPLPQGGSFTPENVPEKGQWYVIDIEVIAASKNLPRVLPVVFTEIDLLEGGHGERIPLPLPAEIDLSNNHLQYALFWFTMAAALMAVYVLRFLRK